MDQTQLDTAQGLMKAVGIAQAIINSTTHTTIVVMLQGQKGPAGQAQFVVLNTDPEFAQITTLVQQAAARRQAAQQTQVDAIQAAIVATAAAANPAAVQAAVTAAEAAAPAAPATPATGP